ncbi:glycosyltransferase [Flavobacterium sp. MK4S-17]|uniref:glycosyltransferase n=1 Tax=Flavobacterium sp. MK4S-17 TaxID=2543737 RepID=UPI001356B18D|nr:glycosyltransferase [Flavobacterium sp. MK4S-17]
MNQLPLVSICCLAYNHEKYIKACLESFLFQIISFKIEILIHDDASSDNTSRIIRHYELKYPDLIKPIYQLENQYSKGIPVSKIYNFSRVKGKYIAICEGDDFWTDPYKLQKQVDILESNDNYGLVHGDCNFLYSNGREEKNVNKYSTKNVEYTTRNDIFNGLIAADYKIRTATVMFRKSLYDSISDKIDSVRGKFLMGDTPMWLLMISKYDFCYIDEVLAVYRFSANSASRPGNLEKKLRFKLSSAEMRIYFLKDYNKKIPENIKLIYNNALLNYKLFNNNYKEMYQLIDPQPIHLFINKYSKINWIRSILKLRTKPNYFKIIISKLIK